MQENTYILFPQWGSGSPIIIILYVTLVIASGVQGLQ